MPTAHQGFWWSHGSIFLTNHPSPRTRHGVTSRSLAELVTRFVTETLCHVVIPGESRETRAAPLRWSGGTSATRLRLRETAACRLITQRS